MNRRGFIGSILALCAAPAIVRAETLMPIRRLVVVDHAAMVRAAIEKSMNELEREIENQILGNDLADVIWNISPSETPFLTVLRGKAVRNPDYHELVIR
jgi:hypothetical protein